MRPNFALSLSHDAILLLHRAAAGWYVVGEADPALPDLSQDLADLQRKAKALVPNGLRCKIVIPNDQIRYLSVDTPDAEGGDKHTAALAALDGATPYPVSELVFDIYEDGDVTHVAAVAKETLNEAEAFATKHGFAPVSFAAIPATDGFAKEPFFGQTEAAGAGVARDQAIIRIVESPTQTELADPPPTEPSFVSRRTVPTFRTAPPDPSITAGFAEPAASFDGAPAKQTPRIPPIPTQASIPAEAPVTTKTGNEAERLTVFGARSRDKLSSGFGSIGLLVVVFILLFASVATFASGTFGTGLTNLMARIATPEPSAQFTTPPRADTPLATAEFLETDAEDDVTFASLSQDLTDEDAAVLDALRVPDEAEVSPPAIRTDEELRADYAVTGIWPIAPEVPSPPPLVGLEDLYITSIDPVNPNFDAVALPALDRTNVDRDFLEPASPAPAGTTFTLDERGMVVPTPEGSLNPDGIRIFAGAPAVRQPPNLLRIEEPGEDLATRMRLANFRPQGRPADLIETTERATFSGLTRTELGELRPRLRPQSEQENALAAASLVPLDTGASQTLLAQQNVDDFKGATGLAVAASLRPDARPNDFGETVAKIQRSTPAPSTASITTASVASVVAPRVVAPKIPSSASASKEATVRNAINLRRVNLIGVYGKPSSRRALVRLSNGRYRKVQVGDRIDGGQVSAIGDAELRYQKSGRAIVLKMPRG